MNEEVKKMWGYLNEYDIYTMEEFEKAYKENKLDIGRFTGYKARES